MERLLTPSPATQSATAPARRAADPHATSAAPGVDKAVTPERLARALRVLAADIARFGPEVLPLFERLEREHDAMTAEARRIEEIKRRYL